MINTTTAYIMGAKVIEKHFTLDKKKKGNDHYHSMSPKDLKKLKNNISLINKACGNSKKKFFLNSEIKSRKHARRGIFLKKDVNEGEKFTLNNLITLRPATGISANNWNKIINKKASKNLRAEHNLHWSDIKK